MKKNIFYFILILLTMNLTAMTDNNYWKNKNETSDKKNDSKDEIKYQLIMKWNNEYQNFDFSFDDLKDSVIEIKKCVPFNDEKKSFYNRDYYDSDINEYTYNHWYMYWNKFLPDEYHKNFPRVDYMVRYFKNQARKNKWSKKTLMMNIITHIQVIQYQTPDSFINDWKNGACYFGYFTPNEIALYERGDCDTKSIFITILLNRLGYDSVTFISREYLHAMVGINIKASGRFLLNNYKKYYFLESTYPDWEIGVIPEGCNNINCWNVLKIE